MGGVVAAGLEVVALIGIEVLDVERVVRVFGRRVDLATFSAEVVTTALTAEDFVVLAWTPAEVVLDELREEVDFAVALV